MKVHQSLIFLILLFLKSFVIGQSNYLYNFNPDSLRFKIVKATRCSSPPKIDGILNDYSWEGGYLIDEFFQIEPKELIATSEKTYVIDCKWKNRVRLPDGRVISNVLARKVKNG